MAFLNSGKQQTLNDPRISFSYGFADATTVRQDPIFRESVSATSIDFEFTAPPPVATVNGGCAEELFFEGKILPSKANKISTLRDELLVDDDDDGDVRGRKGSIWWKERFGFRKNSRSQNKAANNIGLFNTAC